MLLLSRKCDAKSFTRFLKNGANLFVKPTSADSKVVLPVIIETILLGEMLHKKLLNRIKIRFKCFISSYSTYCFIKQVGGM